MKKLISSILVFAVIAASIITIPLTSANATETPGGEYEIRYDASDRVIVSLGDSYSAGEGLGDYYDENLEIPLRVQSEAWLSHRSKKSWPGQLNLKDNNGNIMTMKDYDGISDKERHWYFAAMSGAVTYNIAEWAYKHYYKIDWNLLFPSLSIPYANIDYGSWVFWKDESERVPQEEKNIPPQIEIFDQLGNKKADYVTMTMGGNDVDFVGIVTKAAINNPYLEYVVKEHPMIMNKIPHIMKNQPITKDTLSFMLNDKMKNVLPDTLKRLEENYKTIAKKAGSQAHIIIAGYPKLISPDSNNPIFTKTDAELIANTASECNKKINENIEKHCQGMNISFVFVDGDGDKQFGNHGAYSPNGEYIKGISLLDSQDINDLSPVGGASFHPNEEGARVYKECVQDEIDRIESQKTRVWGKVVDKDNKPKSGVNVVLTDDNNEVHITNTSDSNGNYGIELDYKEGRHYTLTFESDDYEPLVVREEKGGNRITVNAKLKNKKANGTLSGRICKSSDKATAISNATITVYKDGLAYISKKSDANGNYSIDLPNGQYYVEIKATGYSDFNSNVTIEWGKTTNINAFLEATKGLVKGKITNSLTNAGVEGVTLRIRNGWDNTSSSAETVATTITNSGGNYSAELPLGKYTVVASKDGYESSSFNITVNAGTTDNQNGTITPIASSDGFTALELWPMNDSAIFGLLKDKNINITTMEYAGTTYALVSGSELPGFYFAIQNGSNVTKDNYKNAPIAFIFMTEPAVFSSKQDSTYGNIAIGMSFNDLPTKFTQNMSKLSDGVYMVSLFNGSSMARLQFNSSNKLESMLITRHMY